MTDYQKMYTTLFNAATDAIESIGLENSDRAKKILIQAQQKTEELYINGDERFFSVNNKANTGYPNSSLMICSSPKE